MSKRVLLYGATGYSGRLIAERAARHREDLSIDVVLGGRHKAALAELAEALQLPHLAFSLDDQKQAEAALGGFDVVINAAGPFADTAVRLTKSAIATGCHYVDINGEIDVYQTLDDFGRFAVGRDVILVSGAGFTATVSDVMLDWALQRLARGRQHTAFGAVRIAVSKMSQFSRGSLQTMFRSIREDVTIEREGHLAHVPVGAMERPFAFGLPPSELPRPPRAAPLPSDLIRIASAVNVIDTLHATYTLRRHNTRAASVESYSEMPLVIRHLYQAGAFTSTLFQLPFVQQLGSLQLAQLPAGPTPEERAATHEIVILQIESPLREPIVDWRMVTPNAYDFTAGSALAVATAVAHADARRSGWRTPAELLALVPPPPQSPNAPLPLAHEPFTECLFEARPVMAHAGRQARPSDYARPRP